ncbi:MAG: adenylate/guanylate cyclase domain-containing protein [Syntrophaceae bacterium]|nr:adenylate/guanylate cyclase domain-containing protein [Syntrophaceae bacterium]
MKLFSKSGIGLLAPLAAVLFSVTVFLLDPLSMQALRNAVFDQYQRWYPRPYQAAPVLIVDIDEESLNRLGQWPWPRTRIAELIERLRRDGAAAIAMDIVFAEPDRTSPKAMSAIWKLPPDVRRRLENIPDHDDVLAQTLTGGGVVLGYALGQEMDSLLPAHPFRVVFSGESALPFLFSFSSAVAPLPKLSDAAAGNGSLTFIPDADGVVRRVPMVISLQNQPFFSLASESLRVAQGQKNYIIRTDAQKGRGVREIQIGDITVPTTPQGEIWVHYTKPVAQRYLPAWKVMAGKAPREKIQGRILLIGASAQGLMDLRFNPLGTIMPGVEAHAQALEQIFNGAYLFRPTWAGTAETLVIFLGGLLLCLITLNASALVSACLTVLALLSLNLAGVFAFVRHGLLLDFVSPGLALLFIFILGSVVHHMSSERRQRWVREAFSRYVSPNRVQYLVEHPDQLELGGRRQECSFVFTDLAGFTSLMEKMDPADAVSILNAYLDQMLTIAFRNGGTLDRIVGDALAIMFSAPVIQPDHRARAWACALEMHAFAMNYARECNAREIAFGQTRIGIHTGEVIVGNFGGSTMFDYRALGDAVNTAARLETVNKQLGTLICISEATLSGCPDAVVRPVGSLVLKGKTQPLKVFEPLLESGEGRKGPLRDMVYENAFELLQKMDSRAAAAFEQLAAERPHDPLVLFHRERLRTGEQGDIIIFKTK